MSDYKPYKPKPGEGSAQGKALAKKMIGDWFTEARKSVGIMNKKERAVDMEIKKQAEIDSFLDRQRAVDSIREQAEKRRMQRNRR